MRTEQQASHNYPPYVQSGELVLVALPFHSHFLSLISEISKTTDHFASTLRNAFKAFAIKRQGINSSNKIPIEICSIFQSENRILLSTIQYFGLWETLYNPDFKGHEIEAFEHVAGGHSFYLSPQEWIEKTDAIGIISIAGRYDSTFVHRDIAFEFASRISPEKKHRKGCIP